MIELENDQIDIPTWLEGLQNKKCRIGNTARNFLKNYKVHFRVPVGSIEGPRLVLDLMEVWSCVPRVPWQVLCCLVCESIADTADFRREDNPYLT